MKNAKGKTVSKKELPDKICPVCDKAFSWRKKWEKNWDAVRYCSDACRAGQKRSLKPVEK